MAEASNSTNPDELYPIAVLIDELKVRMAVTSRTQTKPCPATVIDRISAR